MSEVEANTAQIPMLQQIVDFLEQAKPAMQAVLPKLPASSILKIDAARERAEAVKDRAHAEYKHPMGIGVGLSFAQKVVEGLPTIRTKLCNFPQPDITSSYDVPLSPQAEFSPAGASQ
jgi:hypothetical protein